MDVLQGPDVCVGMLFLSPECSLGDAAPFITEATFEMLDKQLKVKRYGIYSYHF